MPSPKNRKKIAVIGTGISGLACAWLLHRQHDVTVYEQNDYIGGHSNTITADIGGNNIPVDTGFIVYNPVNYPNLVALFEHLNVPTKASDMSFAASLQNGAFEYAGTDLAGMLAQPSNLLRPRFLRMFRDILRFYKEAPTLVDDRSLKNLPLRDFLDNRSYSDPFIYDHLMPMGAAIWSSSVNQMLDFPTLAFLRFFNNHGLVQLTRKAPVANGRWRQSRVREAANGRFCWPNPHKLPGRTNRTRRGSYSRHREPMNVTVTMMWYLPATQTRRCVCLQRQVMRKRRRSTHCATSQMSRFCIRIRP